MSGVTGTDSNGQQTPGLADSASLAKLPSEVEVDGWEISSSSLDQPSVEDLRARLADDDPDPADVKVPEGAGDPVDEDHDDDPNVASEKPKAKDEPTGGKRRSAKERVELIKAEINALTRQKHDARRAFEAEQAAIEKERAARGQGQQERPTPEQHAADLAAGRPSWDEFESQGKTFAEYQKADAAWLADAIAKRAESLAEKKVSERLSEERARLEAETRTARQVERLDAVKAAHPDFDEAIENLESPDTPTTDLIGVVVQHHKAGYELLYHLGKHPDEAAALARLTDTPTDAERKRLRPVLDALMSQPDPIPLASYWAKNPGEFSRLVELDAPRQLLALGSLIERLSSSGAKNGSPAAARISHAPAPIRPVGATRTAGSSRESDDDDMEFGPDYVRRETERLRRLRR